MEKHIHVRRDDQRKTPSRFDEFRTDDLSFRQIMAIRVDAAADDEQNADKKAWRGDHTFSSDAAKYSLINFIEPEVEAEHPQWSKSEIRKAALVRFEQRLAQDLSYEQKESDHQESVVHWRIVETAPGYKELATDYGGETVTLKKLWDHTREYAAFVGNASAYNPEEEKAQLSMEQAFIRGDTQAYVSVLSHPDAVRYVQVWERGSDGDVVSKQIDLYVSTGRDFSNKEGEQLIQRLAQFQQETHGVEIIKSEAQYAHFMVKDNPVMDQDIRTIAVLGAAIVQVEAVSYVSGVSERVVDMPQKTIQEDQTVPSAVARFVSEEINKTVDVLRRLRDRAATISTGERLVVPTPTESPKHVIEPLNTHDANDPNIQREKISTDSVFLPDRHEPEIVDPIKSVLSEWIISKTILSYARVRHEGSGAAIFWMSYLLEGDRREPGRLSPALGLRERLFHIRDVIYAYVARRGFGLEEQKKQHKESKKNIFIRRDIPTRLLMPDKPQSREASVVRVWKRIETTMVVRRARTLMKEMIKKAWGKRQEISTIVSISPTAEPKLSDAVAGREKEKVDTISQVRFAILYWILLTRRQKKIRTYTHLGDKHSAGKPSKSEVFVTTKAVNPVAESTSKEVTPWVLLSIIWYLAMLRESGNVSSQVQAGAMIWSQPATVTQTQALPLSGIIYMFSYNNSGNVGDAFVIE